jgi:hypothetical protein
MIKKRYLSWNVYSLTIYNCQSVKKDAAIADMCKISQDLRDFM